MALLLTLVAVAVTVTILALSLRRAWPRWWAIAEERVVEPARAWLAPPQQVPLATLQRRWIARALHLVTVTVSGKAALPSGLVFAVSPADLERLGDVTDLLADDTATALRRKARKHDWLVPDGFRVVVEEDPDVVEGRPQARLWRGGPSTRPVPGMPSGPALTVPARTLTLPGPAPVSPTPGAPVHGRTSLERPPAAEDSPGGQPVPGAGRTQGWTACELIALDGEDGVDLAPGSAVVTVGRDDGCDLVLADNFVSGLHAELVQRGGQWVVCDRSSLNGTWVNGERIAEAALVHNDEVTFGRSGPRFVFSRLSRDLPAVR
jgi:hypothetical protein